MSRRPDSQHPEILSEKDLEDLRYNLAHLSLDAVRRFYETAHHDCQLLYDRLPTPKQMQTQTLAGLEAVVEVAVTRRSKGDAKREVQSLPRKRGINVCVFWSP